MPLHQSSHTCPQNGIGKLGTTRFTLGAFAFFSFGAFVFFAVFRSIVNSASPRWLIASAESNLGIVCWLKNQYNDAQEHFSRSQEIRTRLGDRLGIAKNLNHFGRIEEDKGNYESAEKYFAKSLEILRELGAAEITIAKENLDRVKKQQQM